MGAWGVKIFQSDVALDVKEEFKAELLRGHSDEVALQTVLESCRDFVNDDEDQYDFWFAVASYSYDLGRLLPEVKEKAIALIDAGGDLERWEGREKSKREAVLNELKTKLMSEQPPRKEFKPLKKKESPLTANDIYYFQIDDENYKESFYYNYYVFVLVDGIGCEDFRVRGFLDEYPLVYFKISKSLPDKLEDLDEMPVAMVRYDENKKQRESDHRVLMMDGFRKFKKRLNYMGNYDFKREKYIGRRFDIMQGYAPSIYDNGTWGGLIRDWNMLVGDILFAKKVEEMFSKKADKETNKLYSGIPSGCYGDI